MSWEFVEVGSGTTHQKMPWKILICCLYCVSVSASYLFCERKGGNVALSFGYIQCVIITSSLINTQMILDTVLRIFLHIIKNYISCQELDELMTTWMKYDLLCIYINISNTVSGRKVQNFFCFFTVTCTQGSQELKAVLY